MRDQDIIDIVCFDFKDIEGLEKTLDNLEKLQKSYVGVSGSLESKIAQQQQKITELIQRITMCKRKIQTLSNTKQAIMFQSPAQFPKKYKFKLENREAIFKQNDKPTWKEMVHSAKYETQIKAEKNKNFGKQQEMGREECYSMVQTMYSKFKPRRKNIFEGQNAITRQIRSQNQNMGEVPRNTRYADNLLVFNTKVNPYKHYVPIDNLKKREQTNNNIIQKPKQIDNQENIYLKVEQPATMFGGDRLELHAAEGVGYKHTQKEMPQMQFDDDLGDMLGGGEFVQLETSNIDNQFYAPLQGGALQPKVIQDPKLNPQQNQPETIQQQPYQQLQSNSYNSQPVQQQQPLQSQPQSQPQTQQPVQQVAPQVQQTVQAPAAPSAPAIDLTIPSNPPPLLDDPVSKPSAPAKPAAPSRTDLFDEIRNPKVKLRKRVTKESGGINIGKKKENDDDNEDDNPKPKSGGGGMDMMSQLRAQINKRYNALNPQQNKKADNKKAKKVVKQESESEDEVEEEEEEEEESEEESSESD